MSIESTHAIQVFRAGELVWGSTARVFPNTGVSVIISIDHDGLQYDSGWEEIYTGISNCWKRLSSELNEKFPGGIESYALNAIDLRSHLNPDLAVLHFSSSINYGWYARINKDWHVDIVGEKD